ncbi:hypothetical protein LXL04_031723 [Taraxacum kok-saghyz]
MRSSDAGVTDVNESNTIPDEYDATPETNMDAVSTDAVPESVPELKSTPFHEGEKVLAYHKGLIYEAKVLEVDSMKERFYVHYLGWNQKWDEWIGMDRILKYNEENLQKQKELEIFTNLNPSVTKINKRKNISKVIGIQIPQKLKKHLVTYCEYVTNMGKLVKLPCSPNIDDILKMYLEHQSNKDLGPVGPSDEETVNGLRCYFDKALPARLLYKNERQQYEEATKNHISPSKIYGAEHLLRLVVKLPEILYNANIEEEMLIELQYNLQDFLRFLQNKQSFLFLSAYE